MKPHHALLLFLWFLVCGSCRSTKRMEFSTADTIRIEQSIERFALQHDSSSVATSTHDEHFAYVVERITIDSSGKVLRRDIERGKYSARQADTTSTAHNVTRAIADSTKVANETHTAMRKEKHTATPRSVPIWVYALVIAVIAAILYRIFKR